MVYGLFSLSQSNIYVAEEIQYADVINQADSIVGQVDEIGDNFIRLKGEDSIYFMDSDTTWKEKDARSNEYIDLTSEVVAGERVLLKIVESDGDYYIYEVRKEPARSVAGMVTEINDNVLVMLDWQEKIYEVNMTLNTEIVSIGGAGLTKDDLFPGVEIIVTSYSEDSGEDIIKADYIEVVN